MPNETQDTFDSALMKALDGMETEGGVEAPSAVAEHDTTEAQASEPSAPETQASEVAPTTARERDAAGKFTKPQTPVVVKPAKAAATTPTAAGQAEPKAPTSWSPANREAWKGMPREVRDQILKREGEVSRALNEAALAKKDREAWQQTIAPFAPHFQAQGVEPRAAVEGLLRTEYVLRSGTPAQKAQVVGNLIRSYSVDIETLAAALEGKPAPQQAQQQAQFRDPRFDEFMGHLQQRAQHQTSRVRSEAEAQLEAFGANAEFLGDVRGKMATLMQAAREEGQPITLQQAYEDACYLTPSVRTVMEQRRAEATRQKQAQTAQRAQHAAGSVQSEPSPPGGGRRPTMDEALWAGLNGR